jgi:hypothetical protein
VPKLPWGYSITYSVLKSAIHNSISKLLFIIFNLLSFCISLQLMIFPIINTNFFFNTSFSCILKSQLVSETNWKTTQIFIHTVIFFTCSRLKNLKEINSKVVQFCFQTFISSFICLLILFYIVYTGALFAFISYMLCMVRSAYNYSILILTFAFMSCTWEHF